MSLKSALPVVTGVLHLLAGQFLEITQNLYIH